jgi:hypothetical protein
VSYEAHPSTHWPGKWSTPFGVINESETTTEQPNTKWVAKIETMNKFQVLRTGESTPQGWDDILTNYYVTVYAPWCEQEHTKYFTNDSDRKIWIEKYCV